MGVWLCVCGYVGMRQCAREEIYKSQLDILKEKKGEGQVSDATLTTRRERKLAGIRIEQHLSVPERYRRSK